MTRLSLRKSLAACTVAVALLFIPSALAQQRLPRGERARAVPVEMVETAHPAVWRVADSDTVVYLFGTVHALPSDVNWYRGQVAVALESALEFVSEIGEPNAADLQAAVMRNGVLPQGRTLRGMMTAEQRTRYEAAAGRLGLPVENLDRIKPWFAAVTLTMTALAKEGITGQQGVEPFITARARQLGQKPMALETVEYQFSLFDSLPQDKQIEYLMQVVDHMDELSGSLNEIIAAWRDGRAEELARLMNDDADDPEIARVLLYPRNKAWAKWIEDRMARPGIVFMAVGAGHLAGAGSVQDELASKGIASARVQ